MSPAHQLDEAMDALFDVAPYLDLEGGWLAPVSGDLICECGASPFVAHAEPADTITCATCGQRYAVATRLHLIPLAP